MRLLLCLVVLLSACQAEGVGAGTVDGGCPSERPHLVDESVCCAWGADGGMDDCEELAQP